MFNFKLIRDRRPPVTPVMVILVLTLTLTGVLTYQAVDAAASHRRTAERAMRHHATFAAWEYSRLARQELAWYLWSFGKRLHYAAPEDPHELPTATHLKKATVLLADCECPKELLRAYFAIDLKHGRITWDGEPVDSASRAWIRDTVSAHAATYHTPKMEVPLILGPGARDRAVGHAIRADTGGAAAGETVYAPATGYPHEYDGSDTLGVQFGGLLTTVWLNPKVAERAVIGGLPRSRMPLLLGLLSLTAALVAIALRQLRREDELTRLRSDFVSGVSHELRTPLAQIRMFTETLMLERVRSDEERHRALDIVNRESQRLSHLVDNVLQFSRAERGIIRIAPEPTRLDALLQDVADCFTALAAAREIRLEVRSERYVTAMVDPGAVRQVLLNLLDNAVKYGPEGQTVALELAMDGDGAVLAVEDQGPGIPCEWCERVFDAYWRLPRDGASAIGGSGIGLAVVRELATAHGGAVAALEGASGGARLMVRLPGATRVTGDARVTQSPAPVES